VKTIDVAASSTQVLESKTERLKECRCVCAEHRERAAAIRLFDEHSERRDRVLTLSAFEPSSLSSSPIPVANVWQGIGGSYGNDQ
jgi:hypothetical protein